MTSGTQARSLRAKLAYGALAAVLLAACGRTIALGDDRTNPGGAGATGGAQGSAASGGSATDPDGGSAGASGASGSSGGEAGASGATGGSLGSGGVINTDAGSCQVPTPAPAPNPTTAERERAELVRAFCTNLAEHDCIDEYEAFSGVSAEARGCSRAEKIRACEMDELYLYIKRIPAECDDEWRAALQCAAKPEYAQACKQPLSPVLGVEPIAGPGVCDTEKRALQSCISMSPSTRREKVTGARTTCEYSPFPDPSGGCNVTCSLPHDLPGYLHSLCTAPPGLPLECVCMVNRTILIDYGAQEDNDFYASDCGHVARLMADGECVDRLDCCFTQTRGVDGGSQCLCTSDPGDLGQPSCEALAASREGEVVDICPKYRPEI
jgi:hypothetical protein